MTFIIDYSRKPECNKKITISQYSDSVDPFRLKCTKDKGHKGKHGGLIWTKIENIGATYLITWK